MSGSGKFDLAFAQPDDLSWVENVDPDVFDGELRTGFLGPYLQNPNHWLLLAWCEGRIIGKCSAVIHLRPDQPSELYIDEIDVAPAFRQRGIARAMMLQMLQRADELGISECWVGTELDNIPARALYESLNSKPEAFVLYNLRG